MSFNILGPAPACIIRIHRGLLLYLPNGAVQFQTLRRTRVELKGI